MDRRDHRGVRGYVLAALIGALVGGAFLAMSDAFTPQADSGCIESQPNCPSPPLFTWSAIRPGWVLVGAAAGAALGVLLHALKVREQRRRERVGV